MAHPFVFALLVLLVLFVCHVESNSISKLRKYKTQKQISQLQSAVDSIWNAINNDPTIKGDCFSRMSEITDLIGHRLAGSDNNRKAVNYVVNYLKESQFENIHTEPFSIPYWTRGNEALFQLEPIQRKLDVTALGLCEGGNVTAEVVVVSNFDELKARASDVKGKIVLFNAPWVSYGQTVQYRVLGPNEASKLGAVAALVRSVTPYSIYSVHTGVTEFEDGVTKIPAAAITIEDAEMFARNQQRGVKTIVNLQLGAKLQGTTTVDNVIGEFRGSVWPNETLILGGHLDSWDLATGANDDLGGFFTCLEAVRILIRLGLRPKRTIRFIAWNSEELGVFGGQAYYNAHQIEKDNILIAFESDLGNNTPYGFSMTSKSQRAFEILQQAAGTLKAFNTTEIRSGGAAADIGAWGANGVNMLVNLIRNEDYFKYHHSKADHMTLLSPRDLDLNSGAIGSLFYILATIDERLPSRD